MNDFNFSADGLRLLKTTHWIFMPTAKRNASPLDILSNKTKTKKNTFKNTYYKNYKNIFGLCGMKIYTKLKEQVLLAFTFLLS